MKFSKIDLQEFTLQGPIDTPSNAIS